MMDNAEPMIDSRSAFQFKGGLYTLASIQIHELDLDKLGHQLEEKIKQAPRFFHYAPIVIDLQRLHDQATKVDFHALKACFLEKKLVAVGIRGANEALKQAAFKANLALFPESRGGLPRETPQKAPSSQSAAAKEPVTSSSATPTRVIINPVRSGQQIYAPGGDLVVLAPVSHGAELLADGNIHVYAPLRGRALAGVTGDLNAFVFCKSLEAELVSIAGTYLVSEDLKETLWKEAVKIQLQDNRLKIAPQ